MKRLKKLTEKIPPYIRNRYVLTVFVFSVWMLFFDRNDIVSAIKLRIQLSELRDQQEYYKKELQSTVQLQKAIFEDSENLEKFAREKFYMKKPNEVLYVIVEEK